MQYDAFHQSPQCRRRFRPDYSSRLGRRQRAFRGQFVISSSQLCNDMRLVQRSSVGNRGNRADELNRRDANFLPHGDRSNRNCRPVIQSPQQSPALSRHVHAGRLPKTKCADVVVKFRRSQSQGNLDRAHVARLRQNVGNGQHPKRLMVANTMPGHVDCSVLAIENFPWPRNSLIERSCQGNELKSGSRLVQRRNRAVHPRFCGRLICYVGIELRPVRQPENFAGIRIHDHHSPGHRMRFGNRCGQFALGNVLNFFVERQNHVCGGLAAGFSGIEPALARVRHYDDFFALAANLAIQLVFNSAQPFFIEIDEAQHMGCQAALRINTLVFFLEVDAFQIERLNRFLFVRRQLARDPHKRVRRFESRFQHFAWNPQHARNQPRRQLLVAKLGGDRER